jgi:2-dehydro-3-deoxygluconokinase
VWYYRRGNAGSQLTAAEIDPAVIQSASLLHVTGISPALSPDMAHAVSKAIDVARDANVQVSFDLNYRAKLWSRQEAQEAYREIIPRCDIVFAGEDEAAIAVGESGRPIELAHGLLALGAGRAIVKLGARGAVAVVDGREYARDAIPINAVDTIGAGDAFVAGYLADHLLGEDVPTCLTTAVTVGAYACLTDSDWEGMPRRSELMRLNPTEPVCR